MLRPATRILRPSFVVHSISRTQICRYSNSTASSSRTSKKKYRGVVKQGMPTILMENRCAFIKTWDFIRNPVEAMALIRAVELKYGPIENFVFRPDFESPNAYQIQIRITFRDVESFNRLPKDKADKLHIRAPKVKARRPGGIGLDEIVPFIEGEVEFLTASQVSEMQSERTIDFQIERGERPHIEDSPYPFAGVNVSYRRDVGRSMLEWGGFHEMEPMASTQTITNEELTNETIDHVHMRRVLREWADFLNVRNPYEIYPDSKQTATKDSSAIKESSEAQEVKEEATTKPLVNVEEWEPLDVSTSQNIPDPIEKLMEMEDIKVTSTTNEYVSESPSAKGSILESHTTPLESSELQPEHPPTSNISLESFKIPEPEEPLPYISSKNSTPNTESKLTETDSKPSSTPEAIVSDTHRTIDTTTPPVTIIKEETAEVELPTLEQPTPPPPTSEEIFMQSIEQDVLETQLEEARRLGAMARSSRYKKKGGEVKSKMQNTSKKIGVKEQEQIKEERTSEKSSEKETKTSNLESNPRFSGLYNKIHNVFGW